MTLVITYVQDNGIVMAADSARTNLSTEPPTVVTGVEKLFPIRRLNVALSCWGRGMIEDLPLDKWMNRFVDFAEACCNNLQEVVSKLELRLQSAVPEMTPGPDRRITDGDFGVHVAGYMNGRPDFWHVHNGGSYYFDEGAPQRVNAHNDRQGALQKGWPNLITRNGDFKRYAVVADGLEKSIAELRESHNTLRPANPADLFQFLDLLELHIETTAKLWRLSNQPQYISTPIWGLVIADGRITHFEYDGVRRF